jgi:hypothetical protein
MNQRTTRIERRGQALAFQIRNSKPIKRYFDSVGFGAVVFDSVVLVSVALVSVAFGSVVFVSVALVSVAMVSVGLVTVVTAVVALVSVEAGAAFSPVGLPVAVGGFASGPHPKNARHKPNATNLPIFNKRLIFSILLTQRA